MINLRIKSRYRIIRCRGGVSKKVVPLNSFNLVKECSNFIFMNVLYIIWAIYKRKKTVYQMVILQKTPMGCLDVHINYFNGTAVYILKNKVIKYYFKDLTLVSNIYSAIPDGKVFYRERFIVVQFELYKKTELKLTNSKVYSMITKSMSSIDLTNISELSFNSKLERLLHNNLSLNKTSVELIRSLASLVMNEFADVTYTTAHGDVWSANVMLSSQGKLKLIDFDKLSLAPAFFDHVHFACSVCERFTKTPPWYWLDKPSELYSLMLPELRQLMSLREYKIALSFFIIMKCADSNPAPRYSENSAKMIVNSWNEFLLPT